MRKLRSVGFVLSSVWVALVFAFLLFHPGRGYGAETDKNFMNSEEDFTISSEPGNSRDEIVIALRLTNTSETAKWLLINPFHRNETIAFFDDAGKRLYLDSVRMTTYRFDSRREDFFLVRPSETFIHQTPVQRRFGLINGVRSGLYFGGYFYFPKTEEFLPRRGTEHIEARGIYEISESEVEVADSNELPLLFAEAGENWISVSTVAKLRLPQ